MAFRDGLFNGVFNLDALIGNGSSLYVGLCKGKSTTGLTWRWPIERLFTLPESHAQGEVARR